MVNLYRDNRRPCAHGIEPLTNLTRKDVKLQCSAEAFENIKKDISQKIILAFPSYSMHMSNIHYIPLLPIQHFKVSLGLEHHSSSTVIEEFSFLGNSVLLYNDTLHMTYAVSETTYHPMKTSP